MNSKYITATNIIIALCVATYFYSQSQLAQLLPSLKLYFFENPQFSAHQLISHMFMHGGVNHLLMNMLGVWMFGSALERVWRTKRFVIYYLVCGVGAALFYLAINSFQYNSAINEVLNQGVDKTSLLSALQEGKYLSQFDESKAALIYLTTLVGASGALYGLLLGFAWYFPNHKIMLIFLPFPIAAKYFVPALLGIDLLSGVTGFSIFGQNIAHFAHIGGAITGFILLNTFYKKRRVQASYLAESSTVWRKD